MAMEGMNAALAEQVAYYCARAPEYDEWFLRQGRYDLGPEHTAKWKNEVEEVAWELESYAPYGDVLEFAGGTGWWTQRLAAKADSVTVVDASAEVLELNRQKVQDSRVRYVQHDIFSYEPDRKVDFVFFGFWLSHVPSERFTEFFDLVKRCLKPGGSFFFVDSAKDQPTFAVVHPPSLEDDGETQVRKLNDGREFRIFKLFYHPDDLQWKLESLGWKAKISQTPNFFLFGKGTY